MDAHQVSSSPTGLPGWLAAPLADSLLATEHILPAKYILTTCFYRHHHIASPSNRTHLGMPSGMSPAWLPARAFTSLIPELAWKRGKGGVSGMFRARKKKRPSCLSGCTLTPLTHRTNMRRTDAPFGFTRMPCNRWNKSKQFRTAVENGSGQRCSHILPGPSNTSWLLSSQPLSCQGPLTLAIYFGCHDMRSAGVPPDCMN